MESWIALNHKALLVLKYPFQQHAAYKNNNNKKLSTAASNYRPASQSEESVLNSKSLLEVWRQPPEQPEGLEKKKRQTLGACTNSSLFMQADDFVLFIKTTYYFKVQQMK